MPAAEIETVRASDAKSCMGINGVYESPDHAERLLAAMLVQLADNYNTDQDVALMSMIFHTARIIGYVRSGEKGRGLKPNLDGGSSKKHWRFEKW